MLSALPAPGHWRVAGALIQICATNLAPPPPESEAESPEIAANRLRSAGILALVPE